MLPSPPITAAYCRRCGYDLCVLPALRFLLVPLFLLLTACTGWQRQIPSRLTADLQQTYDLAQLHIDELTDDAIGRWAVVKLTFDPSKSSARIAGQYFDETGRHTPPGAGITVFLPCTVQVLDPLSSALPPEPWNFNWESPGVGAFSRSPPYAAERHFCSGVYLAKMDRTRQAQHQFVQLYMIPEAWAPSVKPALDTCAVLGAIPRKNGTLDRDQALARVSDANPFIAQQAWRALLESKSLSADETAQHLAHWADTQQAVAVATLASRIRNQRNDSSDAVKNLITLAKKPGQIRGLALGSWAATAGDTPARDLARALLQHIQSQPGTTWSTGQAADDVRTILYFALPDLR